MVDGHEAGAFGVAGGSKVAVPREELRVDLAEELPGSGDALAPAPRRPEYAQGRDGVYRWLAQAAGHGRPDGASGASAALAQCSGPGK